MSSNQENENINEEPRARDPLRTLPLFEFDWLKDENLLRDEGVYFGLTSDEYPTEKLDTIDSYFEEFISQLERAIALHEAGFSTIDDEVKSIKEAIVENEKNLKDAVAEYVLAPNDFWRIVAGLAGYSLIMLFNFWLIFELFGASWAFPVMVTLGVYLFGLLTSFSRQSWLLSFKKEAAPVSWKVVLEELGIPLVASLMLIVWAFDQLPVWQLIAFFLFSVFFFLFVGKGFLTSIQQISTEYKISAENRQQNAYRREKVRELKAEIAKLKGLLDRLREDRIQLARSKFDRSLELENLRKKKETVKNYFLSEYKLARESKKYIEIEDVMSKKS